MSYLKREKYHSRVPKAVKALIIGFEVIFRGPHDDQTIPDKTLARLSSLLDTEGHNVGAPRLSYLFNMHLGDRAKKIEATRMETSLDALVENVLLDLEIDEPSIETRLVEEIAMGKAGQFTGAEEAVQFLESVKDANLKIGLICNSPVGIPPVYMRRVIEAAGLTSYLEDTQFSSENGMVRPHARPYRYCISNMNTSPQDTAVLTGLTGEVAILEKLGFGPVFMPDNESACDRRHAVGIHALSEISRYL